MNKKPYSLSSFHFWKAYWITLRPYLFFISGVAGFYGIVNNPDIPPYKLILGVVAFFFTYGLGQALTDTFQTDTDSISSPYRPLVQGLITKKQVFSVSLTGLLICVLIFTVFNPWMLLPGILGVLGLITYTFFKRRWWGGPFWNAWVVADLTLMGKMVHTFEFSRIFDRNLIYGMVSIFFSYAVFVLTGYLKDISADRQTNYNTIPVKFGWKPSVMISMLYTLITIGFSFLILKDKNIFQFSSYYEIGILIIWGISIVIYAVAHIQLLTIKEDEKRAFGGIKNVVRGFLLIHLAESLSFKPSLIFFGIGYYLLFEIVLFFRPEKSQV